ncbi:MAG: ribonuclease P protein component [Bacteroidota bacterium]
MEHTFPKEERLKNKKVIEHLFSQGKTIKAFPLKLIYIKAPFGTSIPFKIMVIAPKKIFKNAVDRNRTKRLLREAYRLNKHLIFNNTQAQYALVFLYLGRETPKSAIVNPKMRLLLQQFLNAISHENIF